MVPYVTTTEDVRITVRPVYLDGQSDAMARKFVFGYFIRIENHGSEDVQLLRRHWFITNADGHVKEVEGEGVVGQTPIIGPDSAHEYNSYCVIETFTGRMEGFYTMERPRGRRFRANIPRFDLKAGVN
jgi:ApaG protein